MYIQMCRSLCALDRYIWNVVGMFLSACCVVLVLIYVLFSSWASVIFSITKISAVVLHIMTVFCLFVPALVLGRESSTTVK